MPDDRSDRAGTGEITAGFKKEVFAPAHLTSARNGFLQMDLVDDDFPGTACRLEEGS
jgi:hypothetical protein